MRHFQQEKQGYRGHHCMVILPISIFESQLQWANGLKIAKIDVKLFRKETQSKTDTWFNSFTVTPRRKPR